MNEAQGAKKAIPYAIDISTMGSTEELMSLITIAPLVETFPIYISITIIYAQRFWSHFGGSRTKPKPNPCTSPLAGKASNGTSHIRRGPLGEKPAAASSSNQLLSPLLPAPVLWSFRLQPPSSCSSLTMHTIS